MFSIKTPSLKDNASLPPTFNRLAWSNLAAQSAEQVALAAAPIVAVLTLGLAEGQTGLLQTALTAPFVLFAIPAGLLADRLPRRVLMAGAEALRAGALAAILLLIWLGLLTLPWLAAFGFAAVCGTVVYSVAAPALVPSLVTPDLLPAANARIELARSAASWSAGSAQDQPSASPRRSRVSRWCCSPDCMSRRARWHRGAIRCRISARGSPSCCTTRCCGRCSSPSSSSTPARSSCSRCSCPTLSGSCRSRPPASAPRLRCTASAW